MGNSSGIDQGGPNSPNPEDAENTDETGRGLSVIAALAHTWGTFGGSAGRTVWAEIAYPRDDIAAAFWEGDGTGFLTPAGTDGVLRSLETSGLRAVAGHCLT